MTRSGRRQAAIIFIVITIFIDMLGIGIILPVLPELIKEFADGNTAAAGRWYGVLAATYALTQFVFAPLLGALSDRIGRRPVILISLFGLGADYVIMAFAPSLGWLFAGRLVAGVMGANVTAANAYIADVSGPDDRARNFGFVGVAFGLGFILGPGLGGVLGAIDLRLPFFAAAGLALVNWLYGFFILPESLPSDRRDSFQWRKANPVGTLLILRSYPLVAGLIGAFVLIMMAQRGMETVWVLFTGHKFGWDERTNGLFLMLFGLMAGIVQGVLVRPVVKRLGERRTILCGVLVAAAAYVGYGLATAGWMLVVLIVVGSLSWVTGPAIQSLVAGVVPPEEQGKVQGGLTSLMSLVGGILAPIVFTAWLFSYFTSPEAPVQLPGAPFFLGAVLYVVAFWLLRRLFGRMPG